MKKAIVIGATSGIGKALAEHLITEGYSVGLTGRRLELLETFQKMYPDSTYIQSMDVSQTETAIEQLNYLIERMKDVDLIIVNAGIGFENRSLDWDKEKSIIDINVSGFAAMASSAIRYFETRKKGHLVGISSIAALRGIGVVPAYNASKAFVSNYLQGLRHNCYIKQLPVTVTDVKPGFVDTPMTEGQEGMFWVASAEKAARQIYAAILNKKSHVYVTKRWWIIACMMKYLPDSIFFRMGKKPNKD
jgi:short-subunit dehydrogenase